MPADDTHLLHVVRMALRDQLRDDAAWKTVADDKPDAPTIADVALGVPSAPSAAFLAGYIRSPGLKRDFATRAAQHAARYGSPETRTALVKSLQLVDPDDARLQASFFRAVARRLAGAGPSR